MTPIVIESGIPIPPRRLRQGEAQRVLKQMQVGDSFLVPSNLSPNAFHSCAQRMKIAVQQRKTGDGIRIWRVERHLTRPIKKKK